MRFDPQKKQYTASSKSEVVNFVVTLLKCDHILCRISSLCHDDRVYIVPKEGRNLAYYFSIDENIVVELEKLGYVPSTSYTSLFECTSYPLNCFKIDYIDCDTSAGTLEAFWNNRSSVWAEKLNLLEQEQNIDNSGLGLWSPYYHTEFASIIKYSMMIRNGNRVFLKGEHKLDSPEFLDSSGDPYRSFTDWYIGVVDVSCSVDRIIYKTYQSTREGAYELLKYRYKAYFM